MNNFFVYSTDSPDKIYLFSFQIIQREKVWKISWLYYLKLIILSYILDIIDHYEKSPMKNHMNFQSIRYKRVKYINDTQLFYYMIYKYLIISNFSVAVYNVGRHQQSISLE